MPERDCGGRRHGAERPTAPFRLDYVKLGVDEDGDEFGTSVARADPGRVQNIARPKGPKWLQPFDVACKHALGQFGQDMPTGKEGGQTRAVELRHVKAKFCSMYVTGDTDPNKAQQTSERTWRRAIEGCQSACPVTPSRRDRTGANGFTS
jgi:hypothetical protein